MFVSQEQIKGIPHTDYQNKYSDATAGGHYNSTYVTPNDISQTISYHNGTIAEC
jgi:hypothetical protein